MGIGLRLGLSLAVMMLFLIGASLFAVNGIGVHSQLGFAMVMGGTFLVAMLGIFFITRSITAPLNEAVTITRRLAAGDLSVAVTANRGDEIGQLLGMLQTTVERFGQILTDVDMLADAAVE